MPRIKALHLPASLLASPSTLPVMPGVCLHGNCNRLLCGCLGSEPERVRERVGQEHPTQGLEVLIRERWCLLLAREAVSDLNKAQARVIIKGPYDHFVYPLPGAVAPQEPRVLSSTSECVCLIIGVCMSVYLHGRTYPWQPRTPGHTLPTCLFVFPCVRPT